MAGKCICEICTCGRHKCPHSIKPSGESCKFTEYNQTYKPHPMQPTRSFKPNAVPMQGGEFNGATTNRADYTEKPLQRPQFHQPDQYVKPAGQFDGITSYTAEYPEKQGVRARAIRHEGQRPVEAKFQGEPTYQADYRNWEQAQRTQPINNQAVWTPPKAPFEGNTTFQRDFRPKEIQPRENYKPMERARDSDEPMEKGTTHRMAYIQHPLEKRFVREREQYKAPTARLDGSTENKDAYKGHRGPMTQSFKPNAQPFQSDAQMDDMTTNRRDYVKFAAERPYHHAPEMYKKPPGEIQYNTTNNDTYKGMPTERVQARRPNSAKHNNAPFEGQTSYKTDYMPRQGERAHPKQADQYIPNPSRFEGDSTYKNHYVGHSQAPPQSFRPNQAPMNSDAKFADQTNYRTDFVPKPIQICPAVQLDQPGTSRFHYTGLRPDGHKLYTSVETITPLRSPMGRRQGPMALSVA